MPRRAPLLLPLPLLLLSLLAGLAAAHPSRPDCAGPSGGHGPAAAGSGGFALSGPAEGVAAGATAPLTLRGPVPFRGFLVVPTDAAHGGAFVPPLGSGTRLACGGVGHSSPALKDAATLTWRAPDAFTGAATFSYYVLVSAGEWCGPLSASVAVHGGGGAKNATSAAAAPVKG